MVVLQAVQRYVGAGGRTGPGSGVQVLLDFGCSVCWPPGTPSGRGSRCDGRPTPGGAASARPPEGAAGMTRGRRMITHASASAVRLAGRVLLLRQVQLPNS